MIQTSASTILMVSPHFDDAVFSCGAMLASMSAHASVLVCTVFAGTPSSARCTDWDRECGFGDAVDAMRARTSEDDAALATLGARPLRLPFPDAQYGADVHVNEIAAALDSVLRDYRPSQLLMPLGLFHSDHVLAHRACRAVAARNPELLCFGYEDALYRRMPGLLQHRLADLAGAGIDATPCDPRTGQLGDTLDRLDRWVDSGATVSDSAIEPVRAVDDSQRAKRAAVLAYQSQLRAFGPHGYDDVFAAERFWRMQWRAQAPRVGA